MEKKTKTCRQCSHRERWQCGGSVIQYCGKRKSNRTSNGLMRIRVTDTACNLFDCGKDEQLEAEKQTLINKACEWLRNNMYKGTCEQMLSKKPYPFMSDFIEEFKQAMKGGNYENNQVQREKN